MIARSASRPVSPVPQCTTRTVIYLPPEHQDGRWQALRGRWHPKTVSVRVARPVLLGIAEDVGR